MVRLTDLIKQTDTSPRTNLSKKEVFNFKDMFVPAVSQEEESPRSVKVSLKDNLEAGGLLYEEMADFSREINDRRARLELATIEQGIELIDQNMGTAEDIESLYYWAIKPRGALDYLVYHPVNVAVFALKMGRGLEYDRDKQIKLVIAALLLNIGMKKVSEEILYKEAPLLPEEREEILRHPQYGYELILELGEDYRWLAEIILQSHEREDGSGYPNGLKGKEINEHTKVVGVADTVGALLQTRPYRKRLIPYEAVKEVIESKKKQFSPRVLKALIQEMSVFPIHSFVKLNTGIIGMVIATERNHPLRPTIAVVCDFEGKKIREGTIIKLVNNSLLHIVEPVDETEIGFL